MEGLSKMLDKARQLEWIQGFKISSNSGNSISISHMLYADDTLIFCGAEKLQLQYLNLTLLIFESISGLHINMVKSMIYPVNVVPNLDELADIMSCDIGSFPTTYLGLPLGAKHKSVKMQYLSMGGRVTLINSVLDSIPTYIMSLFPMPSKVQKQLDKLRRSFLWEGNSEGHKFHLVKWATVTQPRSLGDLGIRDLSKHNKSLLMKWHWRYGQEGTSL
ncbi:uncharacterized protein [Nicotiana sylvestris]|uniref:Uncharacterized protein LOC104237088 n=1 Tax=Nicotiana sylvestris TaxID=4096 RepID=A0A1U7XRD8_NICSY|nr:PREDICTED: uncharacterized protein LOC104237088 [Nicotiana sylvestris]